MKILFISGFLGAGKTRFILHMSKMTGRKFVIVENEFADINIDAERLRQAEAKAAATDEKVFSKIVELSEGCICCSLNIDFNHSLFTIANTLNPDYLVVEPSGVAKTGNIVEHVRQICYEQIQVIAPVTIVDGQFYNVSRKHNPDIFRNQLQAAGTVVVSKSESFTKADFERLKVDLQILEDVNFPLEHYSKWGKEEFEALLLREYVQPDISVLPISNQKRFVLARRKSDTAKLTSISFKQCSLRNPQELQHFLLLLTTGILGRVVRAKGYFPVDYADESLTFDLVEGQFAITGVAKTEDVSIVVIGENLNRPTLQYLLGIDVDSAVVTSEHDQKNIH